MEKAVPIATGVAMYLDLRGAFTASSSVFVYASRGSETQLTWFDRSGRRVRSVGEPGSYTDIELSPDGSRLALERLESGSGDMWQVDLSRNAFSRLTSGAAWDYIPRWSPDGEHLHFISWDRNNTYRLYQVSSKGVGQPELLVDLKSEMTQSFDHGGFPQSFDLSRDGINVALVHGFDHFVLPLVGEREPRAFLNSDFQETDGRFSPDGRYFAYVSSETGRDEVYVTTFPEPVSRWPISTEGGEQPRWRADGEELFYVSLDGSLMAVEVSSASGFAASAPMELFPLDTLDIGHRYSYAPTADGQRFMVLTPVGGTGPRPFHVILNWQAAPQR